MSDTQQLHGIFDQIDQLKTAYRLESMDDYPNEKTLLAIKMRLRALDSAAGYRMGIA